MSEPVVLIVVSGSILLTNQADELLLMHDWLVLDDVEGYRCYSYMNVRMWWLEGGVFKGGPSRYSMGKIYRRSSWRNYFSITSLCF